jgi:hypothetical protein
MFRRRSTPPPYEVMGGTRARPPEHAVAPRPSPAAAPNPAPRPPSAAPPPPPSAASVREWVAGAKRPLVLRIPRGAIALAALGLVVLLFAAYWVGRQRGIAASAINDQSLAQNQRQERRTALENLQSQGPPSAVNPLTSPTGRPSAPRGVSPAADPAPGTPGGPRSGLYYFVLATTNHDGAENLVAFLKENGVDAAAVSRNNGRSFQVMALRGFTREEIKALAYRDYEKQLHAVGRRWAALSKSNKDLGDMYIPADPYQGAPEAPANRTRTR